MATSLGRWRHHGDKCVGRADGPQRTADSVRTTDAKPGKTDPQRTADAEFRVDPTFRPPLPEGDGLKAQCARQERAVKDLEHYYDWLRRHEFKDGTGLEWLVEDIKKAKHRLAELEFVAYDHAAPPPKPELSEPQKLAEINRRNREFWEGEQK